MNDPEWIAVDWGTTSLRLWAMGAGGQVLDARHSSDGMGGLSPDGFAPALRALAADWLAPGRPVIACGMVGARQGWKEAPYCPVPCLPGQGGAVTVTQGDLRVAILPGLSQTDPADVMRGEETQLSGLLHGNPGFSGAVVLPGTHSKWVWVEGGEIMRFRTCLTGELFALLRDGSVLRHSLDARGWDDGAFLSGVSDALADPAGFTGRLFALRAGALLADEDPGAAHARLSGLCIGQELAAMRADWERHRVMIIGQDALAGLYASALADHGATPQILDATSLTLAGLTQAYLRITAEGGI